MEPLSLHFSFEPDIAASTQIAIRFDIIAANAKIDMTSIYFPNHVYKISRVQGTKHGMHPVCLWEAQVIIHERKWTLGETSENKVTPHPTYNRPGSIQAQKSSSSDEVDLLVALYPFASPDCFSRAYAKTTTTSLDIKSRSIHLYDRTFARDMYPLGPGHECLQISKGKRNVT